MRTSELDDINKEALLGGVINQARADLNDGKPLTEMRQRAPGRWYEFIVRVTLKHKRGSFGIKYEHQGVFRFCAQSPHDARAVAGHHVKGATFTIDTTRIVEVVAFVAVDGPVGDPHE